MTVDQVIQKVRDRIRIKHLAWSTERSYVHWISRYARFARCLDRHLTHDHKFEAFMSHLAQQDVSASTQNQAFNALVFLYREVLQVQLGKIDALRAKRPQHIRIAPSREDTARLLASVEDRGGYPLRLIVRILYGCGLRLNEALELRLKDVQIGQGFLAIRDAKGGKDRVVRLPPSLVAPIRAQADAAKASWQRDSAETIPVELPGRLAIKYPHAALELGWYWLFPAQERCRHPRTGQVVRWHVHPSSVQRAVRSAARAIGLHGITPHCLRHAYATHALELGNSVRDVQQALGHACLETTAGYIHAEALRVRSPLETTP